MAKMEKAKLFEEILSEGGWKEVVKKYEEKCPSDEEGKFLWVFRGQSKSSWYLRTTFEREVIHFAEGNKRPKNEDEDAKDDFYHRIGGKLEHKFNVECGLLRNFQRKCHLYMDHTPKADDMIEWLALMRHYGAPVRLLDFNYSFFVALYFALEDTESECAVFAINSRWIQEKMKPHELTNADEIKERVLGSDKSKDFNENFGISKKGVLTTNPYRRNQRLRAQKGVFLYPTDISFSFMDNLVSLVRERKHQEEKVDTHLKKFVIKIDAKKRNRMLRELYDRNISRASLFPDLQGFAESLKLYLAFPEFIKIYNSDH
jgi:hypothetical protein